MPEMTLEQAIAFFESAGEQLPAILDGAVAEGRDLAAAYAHVLSAGPLTDADLRRADHPFAKRHGDIIAPGQPDVINAHTHDFDRGWKQEGPQPASDGSAAAIWNADPKAPWLEDGTDVMFGRDLASAIVDQVGPQFEEIVFDAVPKAFEP